MNTPELFQFEFSHYNEKARWALDYKGIPHRRHSFLPGPHVLPLLRLSSQKTVPVLRDGSEVIVGSARIIDHLERQHAAPSLYPADPAERQRALEIQQWFDTEVGPHIRRAFFVEVLPDDRYLCEVFCANRSMMVKRFYRAAFPGIRMVMGRDMGLTAAGAAEGRERTATALNFVVQTAGADGYLVGNAFSIADLAAAAILSPAVLPPEFPVTMPEPRGRLFNEWLARWSHEAGSKWVRQMYQRHRGTSAEIRGRTRA